MKANHSISAEAIYRPFHGGRGLGALGLVIFFWLLVCGCSIFSAVPVTLKEVKDYAVGSQESFSFPLEEVMKATIVNLKATGFTLIKIEKTSPRGFIRADWQSTSVKLFLESVTPRLTTVRSKVRKQGGVADLASEDELFEQVHDTLDQGRQFTWERLTGGMVRVYAEPDMGGTVVGYFGSGARIDLAEEDGEWGQVALEEGGRGYVLLSYLNPVPKPAPFSAPAGN